MTAAITKSQQVATEITALLRARNPLLWIVTREEARVESYLVNAAAAAKYKTNTWDVAAGATDGTGIAISSDTQDISAVLGLIKTTSEDVSADRTAWILRDSPVWLQGTPGAAPLRALRNLARSLPGIPRDNAQVVIIISPSGDVPAELAGHTTVIEWPLPDRTEIAAILDVAVERAVEAGVDAPTDEVRDAAVDAAVGLTGLEAEACYAKSLVALRRIDPVTVAKEKKRVVVREGVLEWFDPIAGGLDAVGGLENVKEWLAARRHAYSQEARDFGLPAPKGIVAVGVSGCGKSLLAKSTATFYGCPLLKLDLGALKSKFVGESEGKLRKALQVIETIGRCVVWVDEIEKQLQGATSGSSDGGVSADALGTFLNWAQERSGGAFVIATANDVSTLPPEVLRKGRFDEVFFVDLPNTEERKAVVLAALRQYNRAEAKLDLGAISKATEKFTGSEIAELIPTSLYVAFSDGARQITTEDVLAAAEQVVPLSTTAAEKIDALRVWARTRARPATKSVALKAVAKAGRQIDLG